MQLVSILNSEFVIQLHTAGFVKSLPCALRSKHSGCCLDTDTTDTLSSELINIVRFYLPKLIVVERAKRAKPLSTLDEFTPLLLSHIALLRRY